MLGVREHGTLDVSEISLRVHLYKSESESESDVAPDGFIGIP